LSRRLFPVTTTRFTVQNEDLCAPYCTSYNLHKLY